ncbi:hypothetical protein QFC24_000639 [Naganishia onofrii]|uniref:Uncharacterized protein n=1 Tax=Naganishia onofrii TaxID=1851511 RepID=A0ACC2XX99_9TREE|nr:hypothetical protein QFC24_000639 [Naganishia onofrii]
MSRSSTPARYPLLQKPLYVYTLPQELLNILSVRSVQAVVSEPESKDAEKTTTKATFSTLDVSQPGSLSCQTCLNIAFPTLDEQRAHFRSDWHRYNAKLVLLGKGGMVTEEEFEEINDGLSSLSGSASSDSEASDSNVETAGSSTEDRVTRLLRRQKLNGGGAQDGDDKDSDQEAEEADYRRRAEQRTAILWFQAKDTSKEDTGAKLVPDDTQLGIYRALIPKTISLSQPTAFLPALRAMQLPTLAPGAQFDPFEERKITLLMVAGGHFAGMVVSLRPLNVVQSKGVKPERQEVKGAGEIRVLKHKTFHRYTTRKKQGGSQSLNDNAKGKANSAGAMLRRYGEQSLKEEIQALMIEWEDEIQSSEKIFLRASTASKRSFWGYPGAVLEKGDERTLSELLRCWQELTRVKVTHLSEEAIKALDEAYIASLQPKTRPIAPSASTPAVKPAKEIAPKLSAEEEAHRERRRRLIDMVKKGRMEPLLPFWEKYGLSLGGVNAKAESWVDDGRGQTLLMIAAQAGQEDVVKWLLEEQRADPTVVFSQEATRNTPDATDAEEVDGQSTKSRGRTAYDLATTKDVRNIFRRLAHDHPDWYDWIAAGHVPSGLSEEKEQEQDKRRAERRKGLKEKAKEREAKKAAELALVPEPEPPLAVTPPPTAKASKGPQKLGGGKPNSDAGLAGLTPEMRARIERERRARAAEARLSGLGR